MVEVVEANLALPKHADALVALMSDYSLDPMGGGHALSEHVKTSLAAELHRRDTAHAILAFVDGVPAGLIVCFEGFSTFSCKPLLNIHDVIVTQRHRGNGVCTRMLQQVEAIALKLGCCKLTLEILEGNHPAQAAYLASGFASYELDPKMGKAMFWQKKLDY
ncbi:MAG: GNAT family N-acetyltransferase [Glaciimonas sp.]|nr:GNAT family N-acetyltransferase [Glaciimonas sp.]